MGRLPADITGKRYGSLTAKHIIDRTKAGAVRWYCTCECGGVHIATYQSLIKNQCTRCAACRMHKRRITPETEPVYEVQVKCLGIGLAGAMVLAMDRSGNIVSFGGCFSTKVNSSNPWKYPPIHLLLNDMEQRGLIHTRNPGERHDAWEKRNRIVASLHRLTPHAVMADMWKRAELGGYMENYPQAYLDMWRRNLDTTLAQGT